MNIEWGQPSTIISTSFKLLDIHNLQFFFSDGTNNYIKGKDEIDAQKLINDEIVSKGLPVVTVLIGVFNKQTGIPLAGVVNQPFATYNSETKQ